MNKLALYTAALIGLGVISQASADNVIYITGSTAFRGNAHTVLKSNAGPAAGGVFDAGTVDDVCQYGNATDGKSTYMLYHGKIGGTATFINVFWGGSEQGIAAVAGVPGGTLNDGAPLAGVPATFLVNDTTINVNGTLQAALPSAAQLQGSPVQADLAFADTSQAVSLTPPVGVNQLNDYGIVGIVPFVWSKGNVNSGDAAWGRLKNVTIPQLNLLLAAPRTADLFNSAVPGGGADFNHTVYLIGRNKGSGTRVNELISSLYPVGNPVTQWSVSSSVGFSAAGLYGLYWNPPAYGGAYVLQAIPHTPGDINDPNNGYETGGDVSKALNMAAPANYNGPFDGQPALTVGFMGIGDATGNGLTLAINSLTLNGVAFSDGAIENGTYSAYGHEHLLGKHVPTNPAATALVPFLFNAVKYSLDNNDTVKGDLSNVVADPATLHDSGILGAYMFADKTGQSDIGYPQPSAAIGHYTGLGTGTQ